MFVYSNHQNLDFDCPLGTSSPAHLFIAVFAGEFHIGSYNEHKKD